MPGWSEVRQRCVHSESRACEGGALPNDRELSNLLLASAVRRRPGHLAEVPRCLARLPHEFLRDFPTRSPFRADGRRAVPAHDDKRASLSIGQGDDGRALVKCHAGCAASAIVEAIGLTIRDLMPDAAVMSHNAGRIVKTYPYRDERGDLLFEVVRKEPKNFYQRRPDGSGGWINRLADTRRVIYFLDVLHKRRPEALFVVEGEKDVENRESIGIIATTNPGGASKSDDKPKWCRTIRSSSSPAGSSDCA
jgi:hypothetical protein